MDLHSWLLFAGSVIVLTASPGPNAQLAIVVSPEDTEGTALLLEPSDNPIAKKYIEGLYEQDIPAIVFGVENIRKEYERLKESRR